MMRILVATDGSPHAKRAAELAARLARELREAEVVLVNAGHIPAMALGGPGADMMVDYSVLEEGFEKAGKEILDQTAAVFHGVDAPVKTQYRRGEPSHEILAAATVFWPLVVRGVHTVLSSACLNRGPKLESADRW